jgi:hypothetical protein
VTLPGPRGGTHTESKSESYANDDWHSFDHTHCGIVAAEGSLREWHLEQTHHGVVFIGAHKQTAVPPLARSHRSFAVSDLSKCVWVLFQGKRSPLLAP